MDLNDHLGRLHSELVIAAAGGDAAVAAAAERLTSALEASFRLTLLEALAEAAEEITRELAPGSVEVRLRGRDPEFVVSAPPAQYPPTGGPTRVDTYRPTEPEDATARLTLRLPEQLKQQVESVAAVEGLSVNAWLVRAVAAAANHTDPAGSATDWPTGRNHLRGWVR